MREKFTRLRTRFAPDTLFEVKARLPRAAEASELDRLKQRLLLEFLRQAAAPEQKARLRRAANDAAALAWATHYPLLFFPGLFEEKVATALLQYRHQQGIRQRSPRLAPPVA